MTQIGIEANIGHDPAYDMWAEGLQLVERVADTAVEAVKQLGKLVLGQE